MWGGQRRQARQLVVAQAQRLQVAQLVELGGQLLQLVVGQVQDEQVEILLHAGGHLAQHVVRQVQQLQPSHSLYLAGPRGDEVARRRELLQSLQQRQPHLPLVRVLQQRHVAHLHHHRGQQVPAQVQSLQLAQLVEVARIRLEQVAPQQQHPQQHELLDFHGQFLQLVVAQVQQLQVAQELDIWVKSDQRVVGQHQLREVREVVDAGSDSGGAQPGQVQQQRGVLVLAVLARVHQGLRAGAGVRPLQATTLASNLRGDAVAPLAVIAVVVVVAAVAVAVRPTATAAAGVTLLLLLLLFPAQLSLHPLLLLQRLIGRAVRSLLQLLLLLLARDAVPLLLARLADPVVGLPAGVLVLQLPAHEVRQVPQLLLGPRVLVFASRGRVLDYLHEFGPAPAHALLATVTPHPTLQHDRGLLRGEQRTDFLHIAGA